MHLSAETAAVVRDGTGRAAAAIVQLKFVVMKESNNKTSGRSQASESKSSVKNTTRNSASGQGSSCNEKSSDSGRTSRSNNPEGINQYTKKSGK